MRFRPRPARHGGRTQRHFDDGGGRHLGEPLIDNEGTLLIDALAVGTATAGAANVLATLTSAINMSADMTGAAAANSILNNGTMNINATAIGVGVTAASADAHNYYAISQPAYADSADASNTLDNNLTMHIDANATATALGANGNATATAYDWYAVNQSATASVSGNASNVVDIRAR